MLRSPDMIVAEFPVPLQQLYHLEELAAGMPRLGDASPATHPNQQQLYVVRDGARLAAPFNPTTMGNCLSSIIQILTRANLVLAPQPPANGSADYRSRTGRRIGAPGSRCVANRCLAPRASGACSSDFECGGGCVAGQCGARCDRR
jgi:hypothetical protein